MYLSDLKFVRSLVLWGLLLLTAACTGGGEDNGAGSIAAGGSFNGTETIPGYIRNPASVALVISDVAGGKELAFTAPAGTLTNTGAQLTMTVGTATRNAIDAAVDGDGVISDYQKIGEFLAESDGGFSATLVADSLDHPYVVLGVTSKAGLRISTNESGESTVAAADVTDPVFDPVGTVVLAQYTVDQGALIQATHKALSGSETALFHRYGIFSTGGVTATMLRYVEVDPWTPATVSLQTLGLDPGTYEVRKFDENGTIGSSQFTLLQHSALPVWDIDLETNYIVAGMTTHLSYSNLPAPYTGVRVVIVDTATPLDLDTAILHKEETSSLSGDSFQIMFDGSELAMMDPSRDYELRVYFTHPDTQDHFIWKRYLLDITY